MADVQQTKTQTENLLMRLESLFAGRSSPEGSKMTVGTATDVQLSQGELEDIRLKAESLRQELRRIQHRGKLDPEVLELELKLEDALNRYYWLWHKCKSAPASQSE